MSGLQVQTRVIRSDQETDDESTQNVEEQDLNIIEIQSVISLGRRFGAIKREDNARLTRI